MAKPPPPDDNGVDQSEEPAAAASGALDCLAKSNRFHLLVAAALLFWIGWTYSQGLVSVPRSDHLMFMAERRFCPDDAAFLSNAVSYNRTRALEPGDPGLFRPGMTGLLAVVDIFLRPRLLAIGVISVLLHWATCLGVYAALVALAGRWRGALLALLFATQYAGMEMILWSHISPYMLSMAFLAIAVVTLLRCRWGRDDWRLAGMAGSLLLLSALFHEAIVPAALFALLILAGLWLSRGAGRSAEFAWRPLLLALLVPVMLYGAWSWGDRLWHAAQVPHTESMPWPGWFAAGRSVSLVAGGYTLAFLVPQFVDWQGSILLRSQWDVTAFPRPVLYVAALGLFVVVGFVFWRGLVRCRQKEHVALGVVQVLLSSYALVTVFGVAWGRLLSRGAEYLSMSTYYYYFGAFVWCMLLGLAIRESPWADGEKSRRFLVVLALLVLPHVLWQHVRVQQALGPDAHWKAAIAEASGVIAGHFREDANHRYGGSLDPDLTRYAYPLLLYREMRREDRVPLYAFRGGDGSFYLGRIEDPGEAESVPLTWDPETRKLRSTKFVSPGLLELHVTAHNVDRIIIGEREGVHPLVIEITDTQVVATIPPQGQGRAWKVEMWRELPLDELHITTRRLGGACALFCNGVFWAALPTPRVDGRITIVSSDEQRPRAELAVVEGDDSQAGSAIWPQARLAFPALEYTLKQERRRSTP